MKSEVCARVNEWRMNADVCASSCGTFGRTRKNTTLLGQMTTAPRLPNNRGEVPVVDAVGVAPLRAYELGSAESRQPHPRTRTRLTRVVIDHSLTIVLVATGAAWVALYSALDSRGKAGQVVGNIVSEWTQLFGLVIMTKYLHEIGSKESK